MEVTHTKTTLRRAKAEFKKQGPRIPDHELRKYERAAELEQRAGEMREKEKRKRQARRKREEKEHKEQEAKRRVGFGLATQLAGYSHTQKQMKNGMETFLTKGKIRNVETENAENTAPGMAGENIVVAAFSQAETVGQKRKRELWDVDEQPIDDENVLAHLEPRQDSSIIQLPKTPLCSKRELGINSQPQALTESMPQKEDRNPRKKKPGSSSDIISPLPNLEDFFSSSTQISRELSQQTTPIKTITKSSATTPLSTQELEITSDDLADPEGSDTRTYIEEQVTMRDFAYPLPLQKAMEETGTLNTSSIVFVNRTSKEKSKKSISFLTTSPKLTAGGFQPVEGRSFTSKYDQYGLSTQLLEDGLENTDSDTEEEDYIETIPAMVPDRDRALMPPPPARTSPKIFKPPSPTAISPQLSSIAHFGFSTQDFHDAFSSEVELSDEESKNGAGSSFEVEDLDKAFWDEAILTSV
ncbi:hypothetical protein EJ08DRAFT_516310 [Tothia fuscella]|uniref:Uncharacterized protein n=1 Tax=Tothia fuscella TaxID=1048955 RepID=A0A9P4TSZ9_9PEZI|nr:hypothetical protein EJ08DRAFT_516310 [Tothia fuscella]